MRRKGVQAFDLCAETEKNMSYRGVESPWLYNVMEDRRVRTSGKKKGGETEESTEDSRRHPWS